jgi:hypothetical protein
MAKDLTSVCYLVFACFNAFAFAVIIGFFLGTGEMHQEVEASINTVARQVRSCTATTARIKQEELEDALKTLDNYQIGNPDAHYYKLMVPFLVGAIVNIIIFSILYVVRSVFRRGKGIPLRSGDGGGNSRENSYEDDPGMYAADPQTYPDQGSGAYPGYGANDANGGYDANGQQNYNEGPSQDL